MKKDIKSIIILLATQCMINLGEIENPFTKQTDQNMEGAKIFIDLLVILKEKTKGNLSEEEEKFLSDVSENLNKIYIKRNKVT